MDCLLCCGNHETEHCAYPSRLHRCVECGNMLTNEQHMCIPNTKIEGFRITTLALVPENRFQLRVLNTDAEICYLHAGSRTFKNFLPADYLLCPATSGLFTLNRNGEHSTVAYASTKVVRFSLYIALLTDEGIWA